MSIYSNVTEQDLINLPKLAEQQKSHRAEKIKNRILKRTHDVKLAESLAPITEKIDEVNKSTQKVGDIIKESNSKINLQHLPNRSKSSNSMRQMLGSLMNSRNSLKITQDEFGHANILGVPIPISEGDTIKIDKNIYELTPEVYKALSQPLYTCETKKNDDDFLMLHNVLKDVNYTGRGGRPSNRITFFTIQLPKKVSEINNIRFDENTNDSDSDLQEGVKIIIPSNIIDIYTRLEVSLGLKLSGHTDTLTEASNLIDDLYKRGEIQNQQQYRNSLNKFSTK